MENNLVCKCVKVFSEIAFHNQRLSELGKEAVAVLNDILKEGVPSDALATMMATARMAESAVMKERPSDIRRCKWWNRGFCREKQSCSYSHPAGDCQDHLLGGCTNRRCSTLRHRKVCKYFSTEGGCLWGEKCAYLHSEKSQKDIEVQHVKGLPDGQTEVDGQGDVTNENKHLDSAHNEGSEEPTKNSDGWVYCDMCDYKCKKQTTFRKHTNTKHDQSLKCSVCGKSFTSKDLLEDHTILDHMDLEFESQKDTSFVFSESMLDEYLP